MKLNKQIDDALDFEEPTDWSGVVKLFGILIYILGIIYAGSHVFSWVNVTLPDGALRIMGYLGSLAVILNAAALPLAIHEWALERTHRLAAVGFYILDLLLIAGFVWADTNLNRGVSLELADQYMMYVSPITFLNALVTWGVLFVLDPKNRVAYQVRKQMQAADLLRYKTDAVINYKLVEKDSQERMKQHGITLDQPEEELGPALTIKPTATAVHSNHRPKAG